MTEELNEEDIINCAAFYMNNAQLFQSFYLDTKLGKYMVRVNNSQDNAFVSVSAEKCTGVSDSMYYILHSEQTLQEQAANLLGMINEAWYITKTKKSL